MVKKNNTKLLGIQTIHGEEKQTQNYSEYNTW